MAAIYSNGGNRWKILGFNFTKKDALSSVYKISMVSTPSPANASTPSQIRTGENHILLVLSILLPAGAAAFVIACFDAILRRRRRRPSVYDELFVLNNVRGHFSIDSLSSDSLDDEINYLQDSALYCLAINDIIFFCY
jgi:hypothetical protein